MWFPGRKSSPSGDKVYKLDQAGLEVERHRAGNVLAIRGPVVKHADTAELRVVVAALLAIAADAVLVSHHLLGLGAHLVTALARLHVRKLARRRSLEAGEQRKKYWLYLHSGKITLAVMYLRRVPAAGRSFTAALAHVSNYT
jgi:hypothetical protein